MTSNRKDMGLVLILCWFSHCKKKDYYFNSKRL